MSDARVRRASTQRSPVPALERSILDAWRTNCRVTEHLVGAIPSAIWSASVPGAPRRTVRSIAIHFHNARSRWIRTLGSEHGIDAPPLLPTSATRRMVRAALRKSDRGIAALLALGLRADGMLPPSRGYTWRNLPLDVGHVLTYFVAHEAHHRGQILLVARQLGHRLSPADTNELWQWTRLSREGPRPRRPSRAPA